MLPGEARVGKILRRRGRADGDAGAGERGAFLCGKLAIGGEDLVLQGFRNGALKDLLPDLVRLTGDPVLRSKFPVGLRRDDEALRHGESGPAHLAQVGAFSADVWDVFFGNTVKMPDPV